MIMKRVPLVIISMLTALVLLLTACQSTSTESAQAIEATDGEDYAAYIKDKMESLKFSGVVRLSIDGRVYEAANGTLSPDSDEAITMSSQFAIGSVSKQFTAAAIMLLRDEGKLSLDNTLQKWYPEYKYGADITIKNMLTMRSGIRDYVNSPDSTEEYYSRYDFTETGSAEKNRKATRDWIFSKELDFKPDTQSAYSNSNYFLLGEIIETASGMSYSEYLNEKFFAPLKMTDTGVTDDISGSKRLVPPVPEADTADIVSAEVYGKGLGIGDGNIISTAADMDKWMTSLREHTVLSEETVKEMTADYSPDGSLHYGYGFCIGSNNTFWHDGEIDSYLTHEFTAPDDRYNLFISTNRYKHQKLSDLASFIKSKTR